MFLNVLFAAALTCTSPDGRLTVALSVDAPAAEAAHAGGTGLSWQLEASGRRLVEPSHLGLEFAGLPAFGAWRVAESSTRSFDSTWQNRLSRQQEFRDRFNELAVTLEEKSAASKCRAPRRLGLVFRAYDEGVAFRYVVPAQPDMPGFQLLQDLTEWRFVGDPSAWAVEFASTKTYEGAYEHKHLSALAKDKFVGLPLLVETPGTTLAVTEAALVNWAGMSLRATPGGVRADLTPLPPSSASTPNVVVIRTTPATSPWRVVMVGRNELDLLSKSTIIQNLNPPPEEGLDFSWVRPGASSWDWWVESNNSLSTEVTIKLVDFAAEMGWPYHTIDGGWYGFARRPNHGPDVKIEPRPHIDLPRIIRHAAERHVGIIVWLHWQALEDNGVEETFVQLASWGVKGVKLDFHDRQDQWMVCWFEKVCRLAAKHRLLVNFHGSFKPTGTERTWPNNLTREAIRGNEFNLFNTRITPAHCATLPFTRFLLGSADFTPGSFANVFSKDFVPQCAKGHRYGDETDRCPHWAEEMGTRAHAIAQCIAFDSALTTLCDWPERYRGADGIEALRALPTAWKRTLPVSGKCGEHYAVVRETPDGRFYFAAFTVAKRTVDLALDFLGEGSWRVRTFADDPERTPGDAKALALGARVVKKGDVMTFPLVDEGGAAAIFERVKE